MDVWHSNAHVKMIVLRRNNRIRLEEIIKIRNDYITRNLHIAAIKENFSRNIA